MSLHLVQQRLRQMLPVLAGRGHVVVGRQDFLVEQLATRAKRLQLVQALAEEEGLRPVGVLESILRNRFCRS
jgi:hypothetical protein